MSRRHSRSDEGAKLRAPEERPTDLAAVRKAVATTSRLVDANTVLCQASNRLRAPMAT